MPAIPLTLVRTNPHPERRDLLKQVLEEVANNSPPMVRAGMRLALVPLFSRIDTMSDAELDTIIDRAGLLIDSLRAPALRA